MNSRSRFLTIGIMFLSMTLAVKADTMAVSGSDTISQTDAIFDLFLDFISNETKESFEKVRMAVMNDSNYNPYSGDLVDLEKLIKKRKFEEADSFVRKIQRNRLLSPKFHMIRIYLARERSDDTGAVLEKMITVRLLDGFLSTGDGTKNSPYKVTRVEDEYDILDYLDLRKKILRQSVTQNGDRICDVFQLKGKKDIWFDVTEAHNWLEKQLTKGLSENKQ